MDTCNLLTMPELLDGNTPVVPDAPAATVVRLATLPVQDYEACRKAEARALGLRPNVLDAEVKKARAQAAALAAPPPPGPADLAIAAAELAGLDAAACALALPRVAKRFLLTTKVLGQFVTEARRRVADETAAGDSTGSVPNAAPADPRGRTDLFVDYADLPDTAAELAGLLARSPLLFDRGVPVRLAMDS